MSTAKGGAMREKALCPLVTVHGCDEMTKATLGVVYSGINMIQRDKAT